MGKIALCLPGGGSRGLIQVGFLKAWHDLGIDHDFLSGTSVGAINGTVYHQEQSVELLEELWSRISAGDVFRVSPFDLLNPFTKKRGVVSSDPLKKLLAKYIDYNKIKANPTPCYVNTTDYTNWQPLTLDIKEMNLKDEIVNFVLASASIPMAFPPVKWGNVWLYDGGMINNFAISDSIRKGADTIVVLRPVLPKKGSPVNSVIDAFSLSMSVPQEYVMDREIATVELINTVQEPSPKLRHINVVVVQPTTPPEWDILDFSFGGQKPKEVIKEAREYALPILEKAFR